MNKFKSGDKVKILPGAPAFSDNTYIVLSNKIDDQLNLVDDWYIISNPTTMFPEQESHLEIEGRYLTLDESSTIE